MVDVPWYATIVLSTTTNVSTNLSRLTDRAVRRLLRSAPRPGAAAAVPLLSDRPPSTTADDRHLSLSSAGVDQTAAGPVRRGSGEFQRLLSVYTHVQTDRHASRVSCGDCKRGNKIGALGHSIGEKGTRSDVCERGSSLPARSPRVFGVVASGKLLKF